MSIAPSAVQSSLETLNKELSLITYCSFFGESGGIEANGLMQAFIALLEQEMTLRVEEDFPEYSMVWENYKYTWQSFESLIRVLLLNHVAIDESVDSQETTQDHYMYDLGMDRLRDVYNTEINPITLFTPLKYSKVYLADGNNTPLFGIDLFVVPYMPTKPGVKALDSLVQALGALLPSTSLTKTK